MCGRELAGLLQGKSNNAPRSNFPPSADIDIDFLCLSINNNCILCEYYLEPNHCPLLTLHLTSFNSTRHPDGSNGVLWEWPLFSRCRCLVGSTRDPSHEHQHQEKKPQNHRRDIIDFEDVVASAAPGIVDDNMDGLSNGHEAAEHCSHPHR